MSSNTVMAIAIICTTVFLCVIVLRTGSIPGVALEPQSQNARVSTAELDSLRKEYVNLLLIEQRIIDSLQEGGQLYVE